MYLARPATLHHWLGEPRRTTTLSSKIEKHLYTFGIVCCLDYCLCQATSKSHLCHCESVFSYISPSYVFNKIACVHAVLHRNGRNIIYKVVGQKGQIHYLHEVLLEVWGKGDSTERLQG